MRTHRPVTPWIVGAVLVAAVLVFVLRGREPSNVVSLSAPSALPVPNSRRLDRLQDLLRSPGDSGAVGDPRAGETAPAEEPPAEVDR